MRSSIVIAMFVYCSVSASAQVSNATFEKKIVLSSTSIRIDSLLRVFSRQTGVEFSFNPTKVKPSKTLIVSRQSQTLSKWLTALQQQVGIEHKVVGSHIILFDNGPAALPAGNKPSSTPSSRKTATNNPAVQPKAIIVIDSSRTTSPDRSASSPSTERKIVDTVRAELPVKQAAASKATTPASPASPTKPVRDTVSKLAPKPTKPATQPTASRVPDRSEPADDDEWAAEAFQFMGGYSYHTSGDMNGMVFGASYSRYLSHRFSLVLDLRGTINHREDHISFPHPTIQGERVESAIRHTTAGGQLGIGAQLSVIRSRHHEVMFSLTGFGRFQSASPDGYGAYSPLASGMPEVVFSMYNWNKQNIVTAGGLLQLHYNFTFSNNLLLGIKAGIQTDTDGELIGQAGLSVGKRF
ncbi:MAG: hypothetical protein J7621_05830 [Niastella sp.]|nr:hypothetical protein [Niastella sp.]